MAGGSQYLDITPQGVRLRVRLTPGAGRAAMDGVTPLPDGRLALRLRVAAKPVDGAANAAVIAFLADALRRPKTSLRIAAGQSSRLKSIEIDGDPADLAARIGAWVGPAASEEQAC
jgi:uncharacterized protein YggU (UPF0235/DUF167 family)